ncbi:NAD-dependent deacetylase [Oleiphilus messinensis]|uniref:protein acetyllysine N-acetyltransferase n=1 Tax=Oleiphilus messinensis TaxID=141451 RepID=A0A1Y0ICA7_9GAMM|nr:NAD-dependent deacylase [Oleiphilus messinensis]ARU58192.1 NAD-dependent deacetylase [Oleiphilus messinensis]
MIQDATDKELINKVSELIAQSQRILFITGAGISAESGLPTYRGVGGLYDRNLTDDGYTIEEALSAQMMASRPDITWKYLWQIGSACRQAKPNRAHEVIAALEKRKPESWVLTQNVDGYHRTAGSENLIEIHGHAFDLHCPTCAAEYTHEALFDDTADSVDFPPHCDQCGGVIRPDVVLFGEMLPEQKLQILMREYMKGFELVFSIGTSGAFPYIVEPVIRAAQQGIPTVEINPGETPVSEIVQYRLEMPAADALGQIWQHLQQ